MNKAKKITSILAASFMFATAFATMTLVNSNSTTVSSLDGLKLVSEDTGTLVKLASKKNANVQATLAKETAYYSVRLGEDAGLRFKYNFTKDMLSAAFSTDDVDLSSYTFGVYVAKSTDLAGTTLVSKVEDSAVKKLQVEATNKVVTVDDVTFAAVLVGFNNETKYNTEFTSVAYVSNGTTTLYSAESSYSYMKAINYYLDEENDIHSQLSDAQVSELTTLKTDNEVGYRVVEEDGNLNLYQYGVKSDANLGEPVKTVAKPAVSTATYTVDLKNKGASTDSGTLYPFTQAGNVYTSSNKGKGSSNASMVITATSAGKIVFDYDVQGEARYDYLSVYHKTSEKTNPLLEKISNGADSVKGTITVDVAEGDTITFSYKKDYSGDKGEDRAIITVGLASVATSVVTYDTMGAGASLPSIAINGAVVDTLPTPVKDGYYFDGWYTSTSFAADDKVTSDTILNSDVTLYAHWLDMKDASPLMGVHCGYDVYGTSVNLSKSTSNNPTLTIDFNGNYTATYSTTSTSSSSGKIENYDEDTKAFAGNIYYDEASGIIVMAHEAKTTTSSRFTIYEIGATEQVSTSKVYGANFDDGKYRYVNTGKTELFIDVLANKVYFDVKAYDITDNAISVTSSTSLSTSSQLVITVKQGDTVLHTFGYGESDDEDYGSTTGFYTTTLPTGVFNVVGTENTVKLLGTQYLVYDKYSNTSKLKFTKQDADNVLKCSSSNYSYTFTFDYDAKTVVVTENKFTITYNWNGHEYPNTNNTTSVWDGSWLWAQKPNVGSYVEEDGHYYVFAGWYTDEALTEQFISQIKPTSDMTLYAKWVEGIKVTLDANGGTCTTEYLIVASGECAELPNATHTEKMFIGWFNGDVEVTNETVLSSDVKLVAKWKDAPFYVTKYVGYNIDNDSVGYESGKSLSYKLTLTTDGKVTGDTTTTWEEANYDPETGIIIFKNNANLYVLNSSTGIVVAATKYSINSSGSSMNWSDFRIYANYTDDSVKPSFKAIYWNDGYDKLIEVTLGDKVAYVFSDGANKKMYIDVTFTDFSGNAIAFADVYKDNTLTPELVIKANDTVVGKFKATNEKRYGYTTDDGHSGTFTGSLNGVSSTVVIDGYGTATVNGVAGTYTYEDETSTYTVVCGDTTYTFTVTDSSLAQVLDGTEGTYTGSLGDLVLTGYGDATLGGTATTYTVSGSLITITTGEKVTYVTIDKTAHTYEITTLSAFAGYTFAGSGACNDYQGTMKIKFYESAEITGVIGFNYSLSETDYNAGVFKGEYNAETKTLTLTVISASAGSDLVGKVYVFNVTDGTLTFVSTTASRNIFQVNSDYTLTCADFKA